MSLQVLDVEVDATSCQKATAQAKEWAQSDESRYVAIANVHAVMVCHDDPAIRPAVNGADLVTPDGMPLVWMLRLKGARHQERVYGPTLMLHVLGMAALENIPVGFYGSDPETLRGLVSTLTARFPGLRIVYTLSPPFRELTPEEDACYVSEIVASGARILFVGLGCPRQEQWMAAHRGRVPAVMLGVGAAFDFHAGTKKQAPSWMQGLGLEWLFRLAQEPRRLWKRYLWHNPRFVVLALADLAGFYHPRRNQET